MNTASNTTYDGQASTNYKEAFALFDKRGNGRVALDSLGDLLRACGQNPTLAEIRDLEKNVGSDCEYPVLQPHSASFGRSLLTQNHHIL
jgi:Ca2+-binding EF-hand superfamily protein